MKIKMLLITFGILVGGFLIMMILLSLKEEPPSVDQTQQAKIVETRLIELSTITSEIIGYGRVTTAQPVVLISEVNGNLIKGTVPFRPAQIFRKGDILIRIDDRQMRLDINSAKSDLLNALSAVLPEIKVDFPNDFKKWQEYFNDINYDKKLAPLPDTQNQKIKLFLSRFNVYKLYFQIRSQEIQLEKHIFKAPFNGSIISTELHVGSTARVGTRLGEVINLDDLEIEVPLPAQDIEWIDRDKPVTFTSSEISGNWSGKIKRIGKNIDTRTQTVQVFIGLRESGTKPLYNGAFLQANIPGSDIANAVSIPRKLIYDNTYVYLVNDRKLEYRRVNIIRRELDRVIIDSGLLNNDTLVNEVMQGVANGMLAKAVLVDQE